MKVIDCFIFYNEMDLLNYRLNILNNYVDYFVLVESTKTHVGKNKELYYENNKNNFSNYHDKIIHIIVNDFPYSEENINFKNGEQWKNENYQRNCIVRGIEKIKLQDDDIIIVSDLDEIIDPNILQKIKNNELIIKINSLMQDMYYYNLNTKLNYPWNSSKIMSFGKYQELGLTPQEIRFYNCENIYDAGWHLSYFGNANFIRNKILNFTHQEFENDKITEDIINDKINKFQDVYGRNINIIKINVKNNNYLPPKYDEYLKMYYTF